MLGRLGGSQERLGCVRRLVVAPGGGAGEQDGLKGVDTHAQSSRTTGGDRHPGPPHADDAAVFLVVVVRGGDQQHRPVLLRRGPPSGGSRERYGERHLGGGDLAGGGQLVDRLAVEMRSEGAGQGGVAVDGVDPSVRDDRLTVAQGSDGGVERGGGGAAGGHGGPEVVRQGSAESLVHRLQVVAATGGVVGADHQEGGARIVAVPLQTQVGHDLVVRPPRARDALVLLLCVRLSEPGRARVGDPVDLPPGKVESTDDPARGAPLVGLGQGAVHQDQAQSAGCPQGGLAQTVRAAGTVVALVAVELTPDDGGVPAVPVLGSGQTGGVVVVDPQQEQGGLLAQGAQALGQDPADLLPRLCRRLVMGCELVPFERREEGVQVLAGQFVQGEPHAHRTVSVQTLVEGVLRHLAGQDGEIGVEGERGGVPVLAAAVEVGGAVVPADGAVGSGVGVPRHQGGEIGLEYVGDPHHHLGPRTGATGDPGRDRGTGQSQALREVRL